jgi:sec-independent protein translocase protein TatB
MEILGIGPSELFFILLIAIIILGPKDMQKAGRTVGRWLNGFIRSDSWKALQRASREIRNLPTNLMREANLEELQEMSKDIRQSIDPRHPTVSSYPGRIPSAPLGTGQTPSNPAEPSIQPPAGSNDKTSGDEPDQK